MWSQLARCKHSDSDVRHKTRTRANGMEHGAGDCFAEVACSASEVLNSSFVKVLFVRLLIVVRNSTVAYRACVGLQCGDPIHFFRRWHSHQGTNKKSIPNEKAGLRGTQYAAIVISFVCVCSQPAKPAAIAVVFLNWTGISLCAPGPSTLPTPRLASTSPTRQTKAQNTRAHKVWFYYYYCRFKRIRWLLAPATNAP